MNWIKENYTIKKIRKSPGYSRLRQHLPMAEHRWIDDRDYLADAEIITIDWPASLPKPTVGVVRDYEKYPRWTKYCRFLDNNAIPYEIFDLHAHNWLEQARNFDMIVGIFSSELFHLQEIRTKYYVLETLLGKTCYPAARHAMLYEDKNLEAYICQTFGLPFAPTYISHSKRDALQLANTISYPVICKTSPASGSVGVELVRTPNNAIKIIEQTFSRNGKQTHVNYFRQKNYIYFQKFIPNDGYDIRAIVICNRVFGYYRKVPKGDYRASGMNLVEKRALPAEAMKIARRINSVVKSPMLVVDMLHGLNGSYTVIEFSPICQIETPMQLMVDGVPGAYIFYNDDSFQFEPGKYWVHELALKEVFTKDYLPKLLTK